MANEIPNIIAELDFHEPGQDENCPVCIHKQRSLIERWYIERVPFKRLEALFLFSKGLLNQHAKKVKIYSRRMNNTKSIVNELLEQGIEQLAEGKMELSVKDLQWAVNHRDKLLGRIRENVDVNTAPILILHTTIPGAGGIADSDVKMIKAQKKMEALPMAGNITFEVTEVDDKVETKDTSNVK